MDEPEQGAEVARRRSLPVAVVAVALTVVVALAIFAAVALQRAGDGDGGDEPRLLAGRIVETLFTVEPTSLDHWSAAIRDPGTPTFIEDFTTTEAQLRALITERDVHLTCQVTEIFLGPIDDGAVSAIVRMNRLGRAGSTPIEGTGELAQVDLVRIDGEWRVNKVEGIGGTGGLLAGVPTG